MLEKKRKIQNNARTQKKWLSKPLSGKGIARSAKQTLQMKRDDAIMIFATFFIIGVLLATVWFMVGFSIGAIQ